MRKAPDRSKSSPNSARSSAGWPGLHSRSPTGHRGRRTAYIGQQLTGRSERGVGWLSCRGQPIRDRNGPRPGAAVLSSISARFVIVCNRHYSISNVLALFWEFTDLRPLSNYMFPQFRLISAKVSAKSTVPTGDS